MFCDRMDVGKSQRVPPFSFFRHCEIFSRKEKNFFFFNFFMFGSLFAIFEPWIWRRLGPVPACFSNIRFLFLSQRQRILKWTSIQVRSIVCFLVDALLKTRRPLNTGIFPALSKKIRRRLGSNPKPTD